MGINIMGDSMIIHNKARDKFTIIDNKVLNDDRLDWKELGLLVYLLSKPDKWSVSTTHLANQRKTSRNTIYSLMHKLVDAGYISYKKKAHGESEWTVHEKPDPKNWDLKEKPNPKKHDPKKHDPKNCTLVNTETSLSTESTVKTELAGEPKPAPLAKVKAIPPSTIVWDSYCQAYLRRYGAEPIRNARVNGQLAQFIQRVPQTEAASIADFFIKHNDSYYVKTMHPVGMLLKDAEKLRTEWATQTQMTTTRARQIDESQTSVNVADEARRIHQGAKS